MRSVVIKVMGACCGNSARLEPLVREVLAELGIEATVERVNDYREMAAHGVMGTPGLVVDGRVVSSGRVPSKVEIAGWLGKAN